MILYFVLLVALFNLVSFLLDKNFYAIVIFLTVGFLTTCVTKNMTYVLLFPIIFTNLLLTFKLHEGMETDKKGDKKQTNKKTVTHHKVKPGEVESEEQEHDEESEENEGDSEDGPKPSTHENMTSKKNGFQNFKNVQNLDEENLDQIDKTIQALGPLMDKAESFLSRIENGPFASLMGKIGNM